MVYTHIAVLIVQRCSITEHYPSQLTSRCIYIYIYNLFLWVIETKHVLIETGIFISCLLLVGGVCELVPPVVAEGSTDYSMELAAQTDPQI